MRFFNKLGNVAFSQLFTYLLQQPIKDTLCGTKVLWRKRLRADRGGARLLRRLRSVRRLRPDLRGGPAEPEDRRDPGPLPRPHLRRDQHPRWKHGCLAAADVGRGRPQDQVRVARCRSPTRDRARTLRALRGSTAAPGRRTPRCARFTPTGTGGSPPRCHRPRWGRGSSSARARGSRATSSPTSQLTDVVRRPLARSRVQRRRAAVRRRRPGGAGAVRRAPPPAGAARASSPRRPARCARRPDRPVRAVREPAVVSGLQLVPRGAAGPAGRSAGDPRRRRPRSVRFEPGDPDVAVRARPGRVRGGVPGLAAS